MNIFVLDEDPKNAVIYFHDIHCSKMILETAQILSNAYSLDSLKQAPLTQKGTFRKHSYPNHPVCVWARENINNFRWTLQHGLALCVEKMYRTNKKHFSEDFLLWCAANTNQPKLSGSALTEHPQCFKNYPELVTPGDPVAGYRKYYNADKLSFIKKGKVIKNTWTKRPLPFFIDKAKYDSIISS